MNKFILDISDKMTIAPVLRNRGYSYVYTFDDIIRMWDTLQAINRVEGEEDHDEDYEESNSRASETSYEDDFQCPLCLEWMEECWLRPCTECREDICFLCRHWNGKCIQCSEH